MAFLEKKNIYIFENVKEYLKLISRYIKSFANSPKKCTGIVMFLI